MRIKNLFVCQFGCPFKSVRKEDCIEHLYVDHNKNDLLHWGYKKELLLNLLPPEVVNKIRRENLYMRGEESSMVSSLSNAS